jgi:hypothetical protein
VSAQVARYGCPETAKSSKKKPPVAGARPFDALANLSQKFEMTAVAAFSDHRTEP